jgi:hypothetical protein
VVTVDMNLVISLCKLMQSFLRVENGVNFFLHKDELLSLLDKLFFFCYTWSVGASTTGTVLYFHLVIESSNDPAFYRYILGYIQ